MILIRYVDGVYIDHQKTKPVKLKKETGMSYQPSGAREWLACPGYALLDYDKVTEASSKGMIAHDIAEQDVIATLVEGAEPTLSYTQYIKSKIPAKGTVIIGVEVFLQSREIRNFRGFVDCMIIHESEKKIELIDYKSGFLKVSAVSNEQLGCYLKLLNDSDTRITRMEYDFNTWDVTFTIHQLDRASTWRVAKRWITAFNKALEQHFTTYKLSTKPKLKLFNYRESCTHCYRSNACPKLGGAVQKDLVKFTFKEFTKIRLCEMPERELVDLWLKTKEITKKIKIVQSELDNRYDNGSLSLVEKVNYSQTPTWKSGKKEEAMEDPRFALESLIPVKDAIDKMTPAEVKKFTMVKIAKSYATTTKYIEGGTE